MLDRRHVDRPPSLYLRVGADDDTSTSTVGALRTLVGDRVGAERGAHVRLVFAGKHLVDDSTPLQSLHTGPTTVIHALVVDGDAAPSATTPTEKSSVERGRFFVYCKKCAQLRRGRLRVRCSMCRSSAVVLQRDPNGWSGQYHCIMPSLYATLFARRRARQRQNASHMSGLPVRGCTR